MLTTISVMSSFWVRSQLHLPQALTAAAKEEGGGEEVQEEQEQEQEQEREEPEQEREQEQEEQEEEEEEEAQDEEEEEAQDEEDEAVVAKVAVAVASAALASAAVAVRPRRCPDREQRSRGFRSRALAGPKTSPCRARARPRATLRWCVSAWLSLAFSVASASPLRLRCHLCACDDCALMPQLLYAVIALSAGMLAQFDHGENCCWHSGIVHA
jgi:hypothetical protein